MVHTAPLTAKEILQWDVRSWSAALDYWNENVDWPRIHTALELGGREGGLSLWLASKGIDTLCSDLENTEATARKMHTSFPFAGKIRYEDIDATSIPYSNQFDLIVFKSILGGIGRDGRSDLQKKALVQMHKALKPGGYLLFAENLSASALHRQLRSRFVRWGNSWRYLSADELKMFLSDFSDVQLKTTGFAGNFGRNEVQRTILAQADRLIFNPVFPESWKYIAFGIARKQEG